MANSKGKKMLGVTLLVVVLIVGGIVGAIYVVNNKGKITDTIKQAAGASSTNNSVDGDTTAANHQSFEVSSKYNEDDVTVVDASKGEQVTLNGDSITYSGSGAKVDGSTLTITAAGIYTLSGTLNDGQIIVNAGKKDVVKLILNGATLTSKTSCPINIQNADKTVVILQKGTTNKLTDASKYTDTSEEAPSAALYSKDDMTINGTGTLEITGNANNGVRCSNDLKIVEGTITVNSVANGIVGKGSVSIKSGTITVTAGADGIKSNNTEDTGKGYINIEGGTINITATEDGIQAETCLAIADGDINITTGGGASAATGKKGNDMMGGWNRGNNNSSSTDTTATTTSAKAIKSGVDVTIGGSKLTVNAKDDAIHSNENVTISGGELSLAAGDDGIHADAKLTINKGTVKVTQAYEGLESAVVTIAGGEVALTTSDDGINGAGGDSSNSNSPMGGRDQFSAQEGVVVSITGGYLYVNASGDGLDSNGEMTISGGTVIVEGPTNDGNAALDTNGTFNVDGGLLVAVGSSGMLELPADSSKQCVMSVAYDSQQSAGNLIHIEDESGNTILDFKPSKTYQSIVYSSSSLKKGSTYNVLSGGSCSGDAKDGVISNGSYSGGSKITSLTLSNMVTSYGSSGMGGGRGGMGGRGMR